MLNESYVMARVSKLLTAGGELAEEDFLRITELMDASDVDEMSVILNKNGIKIVADSAEESLVYTDTSKLKGLNNEELCVMYQRGDMSARAALAEANIKLIYKIASKVLWQYKSDIFVIDDLLSDGWEGLDEAALRFDASRNLKFSTYATWWIRQRMQRSVMNSGTLVRLPCHVYDDLRNIYKCRVELGECSVSEMCEYLNSKLGLKYTEAKVREYIKYTEIYLNTASLDAVVGEDGSSELKDFIKADYNVEDEVAQEMMPEMINEALKVLTDREAKVIRLRFGLDTGCDKTLEEVGRELGVTRERIRQIEAKAITKLKKSAVARKMEGMYAA